LRQPNRTHDTLQIRECRRSIDRCIWLDAVPAAGLAGAYGVSVQVAYAAVAMLSANKYVSQVRDLKSYCVTWDASLSATLFGDNHVVYATTGCPGRRRSTVVRGC